MVDAAKGATLPVYGSAEWLSLPEGDLVKIAAVVVAAECWARLGDDIPGRLAVEIESARVAHKVAEDADYVVRAEAHREQWRHLRLVPSYAERRAAELAEFDGGGDAS